MARRTVLGGIAAAGVAIGVPVLALMPREEKPPTQPSPPAPTPRASTPTEPRATTGPRSVTRPEDVEHLPSGARLVRWRWARSRNKTVQDAVATLGARDILVLPEDERPYEIDSSRGFRGAGAWRAMVRVPRGIVGLGPGAVVEPSASSFRAGRQTYADGLQEKLIESVTDGAFFGNFTLRGRDFGEVAYHGIQVTGSGASFQAMRFQGAHRGWTAHAPGEAAAITAYSGSDIAVRNVEIDGRDPRTGVAVGTSPLMFNRNRRTVVTDTWMHHIAIGMPSWWECADIWSERMYLNDVAQAPQGWSPGINVENSTGDMTFVDPTLLLGSRVTGNTGKPLNVGGDRGTTGTITIRNPTLDGGAEAGRFGIREYGIQAPGEVRYTIVTAAGDAVPYDVSR